MKAKEYAAILEEGEWSEEAMEKVMRGFLFEASELMEIRHIKTDAALFSIFDELDRKWQAFIRKVTKNPEATYDDGYHELLKDVMPEVYQGWARHNAKKRGFSL